MDRNIKYKQVTRLMIFGDDDINTKSTSQYVCGPFGLTSITIISGGTGYNASYPPVLLFNGVNNGYSCQATCTISGGGITAVNITSGGMYSALPNITVTTSVSGVGTITGGTLYTLPPLISVNSADGNGSGSTATCTISGGVVNAITITNAGSGYTIAPTLTFKNAPTDTTGSGASCSTTLYGSGASLQAVSSSNISNGKRMRFALNNALNDVKLSCNARCIVENCNIPSLVNMGGKYVLLRVVTSTQDKCADTKKFLNGNPILLSMVTQSTTGATNVLSNASEFFYNINIPTNFLQNSYVDFELECPTATSAISFITNLGTFYISLIIIDEDPELTHDLTLAPPIDYKNYNVNQPIRYN